MYRSASWNRIPHDYFMQSSTHVNKGLRKFPSFEANLPLYDPISEIAKKERARVKFAENAVHVIPLLLLLCAIILWSFSNPEINLEAKGDLLATRIEGLTIEGLEIHNDGDGIQTGALPIIDFGDLESSSKENKNYKSSRIFENILK